MAIKFFQERSLSRLVGNLKNKAETGNIDSAQRLIADYVKPEIVHSRSINLLHDTSIIQHAFQNDSEELFSLRGGMNTIVGGPLARGELVAFLAPPKSGKTWWMIRYRNSCDDKRAKGFICLFGNDRRPNGA